VNAVKSPGLRAGTTVVNKAEAGHKAPLGLRTVALFEFIKGLAVLTVGMSALLLLHTDVQAAADHLVERLHADPAWWATHEFIKLVSDLTDTRIKLVAFFAAFYATVRVIEAYGLWHDLPWAEWFAVISAAIYLPVEILHIYRITTEPEHLRSPVLSIIVLVANIAIVAYLSRLLGVKHYEKKASRLAQQGQAA
jgi:uncharacterized membrane protein (DUF2068 family)